MARVPEIVSPNYAYAQVNRSFQYLIRARYLPDSFGVIGDLPDGLSINLNNGAIGGFPSTAEDPVNVTVTASNELGTDELVVVFHIYEEDQPFFLGPLSVAGQIGVPMSVQLLWDGSPSSFAMPVVPGGLTFDTSTGILSGTPDTAMIATPLVVQASNGFGTAENRMNYEVGTEDNVPEIVSPLTVNGTVGVLGQYQIVAINAPDEYDLNPILPWIDWHASTGRFNYLPVTAGTFEVQISAGNTAGTDTETLTFIIAEAGGPPPDPDPGPEPGPIAEPAPELIAGGFTFGAVKTSICLVVDNGVNANDSRVMRRTNEATWEALQFTDPRTNGRLVPVGTMVRANVVAIGDPFGGDSYLLLPPQLENAMEVVVKPGSSGSTAYGDSDISQGWYAIADQFTWINPAAAHDNPTVDFGLVPDPVTPTILRRKLLYPGLEAGAMVSVTGKKRYIPITSDGQYLLIQNVPALKLIIQSIEKRENGAPTEVWKSLKLEAREMLSDECFNHLMDPNRMQRRRGQFEKDIARYAEGTKGWIRAHIALDNPMIQTLGKVEIDRLLDRAEAEAIRMGNYKGTLKEFDAEVFGGDVFLPEEVESAIAVSFNGEPLQMRSILFQYLENGPHGWDNSCGGYVRDLGEENLGGLLRRKFRISGSITEGQCMKMVCKLRWIKKAPADMMTIRNLEALELLCEYFLYRRNGQINEAGAAYADAKGKLNNELSEYLKGIKHTIPFAVDGGLSNADLGEML